MINDIPKSLSNYDFNWIETYIKIPFNKNYFDWCFSLYHKIISDIEDSRYKRDLLFVLTCDIYNHSGFNDYPARPMLTPKDTWIDLYYKPKLYESYKLVGFYSDFDELFTFINNDVKFSLMDKVKVIDEYSSQKDKIGYIIGINNVMVNGYNHTVYHLHGDNIIGYGFGSQLEKL